MKYVYSEAKGYYNANKAFSRQTTESVAFSILECILLHPGITQKYCNCRTAPAYGCYSGYRSTIYARLVKDGALKLGKGNRGYYITQYGKDIMKEAFSKTIDSI